jgi:hypothetical protein
MISIEPDAEDLAFDAHLPLAVPTCAALKRVDNAVRDERKLMDSLRKGFTPTLNAGALGLGRFGYAVREIGAEWLCLAPIKRASTPEQESNNVHLWTLGSQYVLRIKREPVEGIAEGTQRLFAQLPAADRTSTVFLTWDIDLNGQISAARFVCVDEPKWTISLGRLVAHGSAPVVAIPSSTPRGPVVRSKLTQRDEQRGDG